MPPLENTYCHSPSPVFFCKGEGDDRRKSKSFTLSGVSDDELVVMAQRRVSMGTIPFVDSQSLNGVDNFHRNRNRQTTYGVDWLAEYLGCTCIDLDLPTVGKSKRPINATETSANRYENVIAYPIAVYPDRLNSPALVEQRRRSLMKQFTFQPVQHDFE